MNTIILSGSELVTSTAAEDARKLRDELLAKSSTLPSITDQPTAMLATETLRDLRGFYKMIEEGRIAAKAPVLEIGRRIDLLASELRDQVEAEGLRIGKLLGQWNADQEKIAEQKRRDAAAEERRIRDDAERKEREAQAEQRRKDEEARQALQRENDRIAEEARQKAARARTEGGRERAEQEAEQRKKDAEEQARKDKEERDRIAAKEQKARDDEEARRVAANREQAALATAKPKGTATSLKIMYEVTDIVALYEAAPYLVTMTENVAALKSALKGLQPGKHLPGVKHWTEAATITRG